MSGWRQSPRQKYANQKSHAARRGIPWLFTYSTWWAMWRPYWADRGRLSHQLCMCRNSDSGPYSPANCRIDTNANNLIEAAKVKRGEPDAPLIPANIELRREQPYRPYKSLAGVFWHKRDRRWAACIKINNKTIHLGNHTDWFEAVCARKSAENKYWIEAECPTPLIDQEAL